MMENYHPDLIVLDLYLADPCGLDVLRILRDDRYQGPIVLLSGPSMTSIVHDALPMAVKVVHAPEQIAGHFDLGELALAIETSLKSTLPHERKPYRGQIARRAHEFYEEGGRHDGRDVDDWLRAEQDLAS
jgi:DNA-binding response OmpR family regulator